MGVCGSDARVKETLLHEPAVIVSLGSVARCARRCALAVPVPRVQDLASAGAVLQATTRARVLRTAPSVTGVGRTVRRVRSGTQGRLVP